MTARDVERDELEEDAALRIRADRKLRAELDAIADPRLRREVLAAIDIISEFDR